MLLLIFLIGMQADDTAARAHEAAKKAEVIATCSSDQECAAKMKNAKEWLKANSQFQLAVDQPDLIATYPPVYANTGLSFVVEKRPVSHGGYEIAARGWCGNVFKCRPKPKLAIAELRKAIR